jgi:hypothetical protein
MIFRNPRGQAENAEEEEDIGTRINTDFLDWKKEKKSAFICPNP